MLEALVVAGMVVAPIGAYLLVARRPAATRGRLVWSAALAGAAPVLVWLSGVALLRPADFGVALLPYVPLAAALGAVIGGAGLVARWLGDRLAR